MLAARVYKAFWVLAILALLGVAQPAFLRLGTVL